MPAPIQPNSNQASITMVNLPCFDSAGNNHRGPLDGPETIAWAYLKVDFETPQHCMVPSTGRSERLPPREYFFPNA